MHKARKKFGQHFLSDQNILDRIVRSINPKVGQRILEIGPGQGAMTALILRKASKMEAIEIDFDLVEMLKSLYPTLILYPCDILRFEFSRLQAQPASLRIIGNLPYNISTPILFLLLNNISLIQDMHLMLQKEVIDRMVASPGNKIYGRLSVMLQPFFDIQRMFNIAPNAFSPPPKVDSSFVRMVPWAENKTEISNRQHYENLVRAAFSQRRKTLRNTLKGLLDDTAIRNEEIDPQRRPETLSISEFARLSNCYTNLVDNKT